MAVTYANNVKTGRLQVVADLTASKTLGAATGTASAGSLVIGDGTLSGATGVLATLPLSTTPFTVGTTTLTVTGNPSASASATGTASKAEIRNNAGTVIISGLTVTASGGGGDVIIGTTAITTGLTVTCTGASSVITHG